MADARARGHKRTLPWDHPTVLSDRLRQGQLAPRQLELADDAESWREWEDDILPARTWRLFACDLAERALARATPEDRDPWLVEALAVGRRLARGRATGSELDQVKEKAWHVGQVTASSPVFARAAQAVWSAVLNDASSAARRSGRAAELAARQADTTEEAWQDRHLRRCLLWPSWPGWRETE